MPPPFNPNESVLFFEAKELATDTFVVIAFRGEEAISRPFRFEIDLASLEDDIESADVIGKEATFTAAGREIKGIVSEFEYLGFAANNQGYRAVLVPQLWRLSLRTDSEIFFTVTPQELLSVVLTDVATGWDLTETYASREYYTQYGETDLAFLSRIAEHYGISYRFVHSREDSAFFFDDSTQAPAIEGEATLLFDADATLSGADIHITDFTERDRMVPAKVIVKDYNYRTPETALISEHSVLADRNDTSLYYEYGTHHKDQTEGDLIARVRAEEIEAGRRRFHGKSNCPELSAGFKFSLTGHFRSRMDGDYLVTEVQSKGDHRFQVGRSETLEHPAFENEFVCIPLDVPYRPPRTTPIPKVAGIMSARLETAGGQYAHLDEDGRYRAKMHFDLSDRANGEASHPIRMNQPYSGPGYGMHFPSHADAEVVWACINGDPDRPMAIGTVPNPSNASPVSSDNKTQGVIRTQGGNEIVMDDTRGGQDFLIHASHNNTVTVENNQRISVKKSRTDTVGGDVTQTIRGSRKMTVDKDNTETIGKNQTVTVTGDSDTTIGKKSSLLVGESLEATVGTNVGVVIGKNLSLEVGQGMGALIREALSIDVGKDVFLFGGKKVEFVATDELVLTCGEAEIRLKKDGEIKISGKNVSAIGTKDVKLRVGGQSVTLDNSSVTSAGALISTTAIGLHEITGAVVKIN